VIIVEAPVVPISPVITVLVPWLVMPAPPPNTAKEAAEPRMGAAGLKPRAPDLTEAAAPVGDIGLLQAAMKPAIRITPIPPSTLFVNLFIVYLLYISYT
jgi:hypothetical protein